MSFVYFFLFVIAQRLLELGVAKRNEKRMKHKGALEFGQSHYKYIVLLHIGFLVATAAEVILFQRQASPFWPGLLLLFGMTQGLRIWAMVSLGEFWNTKILVLPNASIISKGPYKYIRHPNYAVVVLEIILIPLLFQAYITAILFTILNAFVLTIRIRQEERALIEMTDYAEHFKNISQFPS
ncbi:isoprenylcysteine carboxyl methyltransferase family protein [Microbacteriaceae bacterium 4G12]